MGYKTYTCKIARNCGGCEWLAVPYPIQLKRKQAYIEQLFDDFLTADSSCMEDIVGVSGEAISYRYKAATPFAPGPHRRILHGFYQRGSHRIVGCESCLVEHPRARPIFDEVARAAKRYRIPAYDEDSGKGVLRHAVLRFAYASNKALLTLVTNGKNLRQASDFANELHRRCPELVGIVQNINARRTNAILGHESYTLWGAGTLQDELLGCRFEIGPTSFYQTNPAQTEVLYSIALQPVIQLPGARLLDAYCGTGTIGICAAAQAEAKSNKLQVIGVDSVHNAIECAQRNARANQLESCCRYICADATKWMQKNSVELQGIDTVLLDPPRAGTTQAFIEGIQQLHSERVIYISCNPETQVRDLTQLCAGGFSLVKLTPVDMFPHTKHVETVAVLDRR